METPSYVILRCFAGVEPEVLVISSVFEVMVAELRNAAVKFVEDEVGKNHFVNTLDGEYAGTSIQNCPPGWILKYTKPSNTDKCIKRIDCYMSIKQKGWTGSYYTPEFRGYYCIVEVKPSTPVDKKPSIKDIVKSKLIVAEDKYAGMLDDIVKCAVERLKKVPTDFDYDAYRVEQKRLRDEALKAKKELDLLNKPSYMDVLIDEVPKKKIHRSSGFKCKTVDLTTAKK
jgi:hypothetical protein